MKKLIILFIGIANSVCAQLPQRTSLLEEFTGENCGPCAYHNPNLDAQLANPLNANKIIAIKWSVPIPPGQINPTSLYFANKAEIDWRKNSVINGGYGYTSQYTPTASVTNGILNAPTNLIDGQYQWAYGVPSNNPLYFNNSVVNTASSYTTPFSMTVSPTWDYSLATNTVVVTIQAATTFTTAGPLVLRLCLVERSIDFATPPGANGETHFEEIVRKSYPSIQVGKLLPSTWSAGQVQTYTIYCLSPLSVVDLTQQAYVGFIQDDSNKKIWQAARTNKPIIDNDISVTSISAGSEIICTSNYTPTINFTNVGSNAITSFSFVPKLDGINQPAVYWSGMLASQASTNITLNSYLSTAGSHTLSVSVTGVSGGDIATYNNTKNIIFGVANTYFTGAIAETFATNNFPPQNWFIINGGSAETWKEVVGIGNGDNSSAWCQFGDNLVKGDVEELYLKPLNFQGISNPVITFDHAYTGFSTFNVQDKLELMVSNDCGNTWITAFSKSGIPLETAVSTNNYFYPGPSDWANNIIPLPSASNQSQVLIKFVGTSDRGNNLFIDNVNVTASNSLTKNSETINSFVVYPNPAQNLAVLSVSSLNEQPANIYLSNVLGERLVSKAQKLVFGNNEINLNTSELPTGVYTISLETENGFITKKVIISR